MTTQLITRERAQLCINQSSYTAEEATAIDLLIRAVSERIERHCHRAFALTRHDEVHWIRGWSECGIILALRNYPVVSIEKLARGYEAVLAVQNTNTTINQRATVAVTPTGLRLTRVASGVTTIDETVTFASNATMGALAVAVSNLSGGWSATAIMPYALRPSADLLRQGAINCLGKYAYIRDYVEELSEYTVEHGKGWIHGLESDTYRVVYTAGYEEVPEPVQEACAEWVKELYALKDRDPAAENVSSFSNSAGGTNLYLERPMPPKVKHLLAPYKRVLI